MSSRVYLVLCVIVTLIGGSSWMPAAHAYTGAFLSHPRQAAPLKVTGTNVVIADKSWVGFHLQTCLTVHDAHNVYIHDVDFDGCGGGVFLLNLTPTRPLENVPPRHTPHGTIGARHAHV